MRNFMKYIPMNADHWFVAFALLVVVFVSSYGATRTGYQTGQSLLYQIEAMSNPEPPPCSNPPTEHNTSTIKPNIVSANNVVSANNSIKKGTQVNLKQLMR